MSAQNIYEWGKLRTRLGDAERRLKALVDNQWVIKRAVVEGALCDYIIEWLDPLHGTLSAYGASPEGAIDNALLVALKYRNKGRCPACVHFHAPGQRCNAPMVPPCACEVGK